MPSSGWQGQTKHSRNFLSKDWLWAWGLLGCWTFGACAHSGRGWSGRRDSGYLLKQSRLLQSKDRALSQIRSRVVCKDWNRLPREMASLIAIKRSRIILWKTLVKPALGGWTSRAWDQAHYTTCLPRRRTMRSQDGQADKWLRWLYHGILRFYLSRFASFSAKQREFDSVDGSWG